MSDYDQVPWIYRLPIISHYYGDSVRLLFLSATVLMLVGAPLYTDDLASQSLAIIIGALALVVIAGLMSPRMRFAKVLGAACSVIGAAVYETWALSGYSVTPGYVFLLREFIALIFFFALYFSLKTVRADVLEPANEDDFAESHQDGDDDDVDRHEGAHRINHERVGRHELPEDEDDFS